MNNVFNAIDGWDFKGNMLRDDGYLRKLVFVFSLSMFIPWAVFGFDSGIGILEIWNNNWQLDWSVYGMTFHFSAFVIYGLMYVAISWQLSKLHITRSKNVFYTVFLVWFNIAVFEHFFMLGYNHYQHHFGLLEWYIREFLFLQQFLWPLILGALTILALHLDGYQVNEKKVVGRLHVFHFDKKMLIPLVLTIGCALLWVYYPFPVETIGFGDWVSNTMFPQTHYYSVYEGVYYNFYVENNLIHLVNTVSKAMFAVSQVTLLAGYRRVEDVHT